MSHLTHENLRITILVLDEIDHLQARTWTTNHENELRTSYPHDDGLMFQTALSALNTFTICSMGGNAQGTKMLSTAFIRGLQIVGLEEEVAVCEQTLEGLDHE